MKDYEATKLEVAYRRRIMGVKWHESAAQKALREALEIEQQLERDLVGIMAMAARRGLLAANGGARIISGQCAGAEFNRILGLITAEIERQSNGDIKLPAGDYEEQKLLN